MHPSADKNKEWQYPPLTPQDYEEVFNYYKWDGHEGVTPRGNAYTITVNFPLADEDSYNQHGFRVKLCVTIFGTPAWKYPAVSGKTASDAEKEFKEMIELLETHDR